MLYDDIISPACVLSHMDTANRRGKVATQLWEAVEEEQLSKIKKKSFNSGRQWRKLPNKLIHTIEPQKNSGTGGTMFIRK